MDSQNERGFSINIFLADGTPEGLRIVEKSGWIGKALICSRTQFPEIKKRPELNRPGVYLLLGDTPNVQVPLIYIGEADPVWKRIEEHFREKEFWTQLIVFVSKDDNLNKAHIQHLEARLVELARAAKRCHLENENIPGVPTLSEAVEADMEHFIDEIRTVYATLGVNIFELPKVKDAGQRNSVLLLRASGAEAKGYDTPEGFIVTKGSLAVIEETPSLPETYRIIRADLIKQKVLLGSENYFVLTQDYTFASPSQAASVLTGRSTNGRIEWKTGEGKTLKQLQEEAL